MKPKDQLLADDLRRKLTSFSNRPLLGIRAPERLDAFIQQLVDSIRRIKYITVISQRRISPIATDPTSTAFDPIKASVWHHQQGNINEAFWLAFLSVHFGKHKTSGWNLVRAVYGALGNSSPWTWQRTSANPQQFIDWLGQYTAQLKHSGSFGNHRKYESLSPNKAYGTAHTIVGYINWVGSTADHTTLLPAAVGRVGTDPRALFRDFYKSMRVIPRFGRMAIFDFLSLLGKLGLLPIEPGSTYMTGATGPLHGARLLFEDTKTSSVSPKVLNSLLDDLEGHLGLYFGMQVLEDAICNWQKSPAQFHHFRG